VIFLQPRLNLTRDRFQLRLGTRGTDYEKIGEGRNFAQIEDDDVLCFLVSGKFRAKPG